mmetsp:Transcript_54913/g.164425  ORF Transcript_54913/g.164425 Transcript_54913/m.164425 type:complete len:309 (+) Transcript_54913:3620-4546(+)
MIKDRLQYVIVRDRTTPCRPVFLNRPTQLGHNLLHGSGGLEHGKVNCLAEPLEAAKLKVIPLPVGNNVLLSEVVNDLIPCCAEHDPFLNANIQQSVHIALQAVGVSSQEGRALLVRVGNVALGVAEEAGGRSTAASGIRGKHLLAEVLRGTSEVLANVFHIADISKVVRETNGRTGEGLPNGVPDAHVDEVNEKLWEPPHGEKEGHFDEALVRVVLVVVSELKSWEYHGIDFKYVRKKELPGDHCKPEKHVDDCVAEGLVDFFSHVETAQGEQNVQERLEVLVLAGVDHGGQGGVELGNGLNEPGDHA